MRGVTDNFSYLRRGPAAIVLIESSRGLAAESVTIPLARQLRLLLVYPLKTVFMLLWVLVA